MLEWLGYLQNCGRTDGAKESIVHTSQWEVRIALIELHQSAFAARRFLVSIVAVAGFEDARFVAV